MNYINEFFLAGYSYLAGNLFIFAAVLLSFFYENKTVKGFVCFFLIGGLALIIFSPCPVPGILYTITGLFIFALFLALQLGAEKLNFTHIVRIALVICCFYAVYIETKYWKMPEPLSRHYHKVFVLGGSLSSEKEKPWPEILSEKYGVKVLNYSEPGALMKSSVDRADVIFGRGIITVIELGRADTIRKTPVKTFTANLEKILKKTSGPSNAVIMFEVPSADLSGSYSIAQRALAKQYGAGLIPRRVLLSVFSRFGKKAGNSLSPAGHSELAERVWSIIGSGIKCKSSGKVE
jgi:hypothetical protein